MREVYVITMNPLATPVSIKLCGVIVSAVIKMLPH